MEIFETNESKFDFQYTETFLNMQVIPNSRKIAQSKRKINNEKVHKLILETLSPEMNKTDLRQQIKMVIYYFIWHQV